MYGYGNVARYLSSGFLVFASLAFASQRWAASQRDWTRDSMSTSKSRRADGFGSLEPEATAAAGAGADIAEGDDCRWTSKSKRREGVSAESSRLRLRHSDHAAGRERPSEAHQREE